MLPTWILQSKMRLWFRMSRVKYLLADVLGHNLVEHVISGQRQGVFVQEEPLREQRVQIMGAHHVVFPLVRAATQEEAQKLERLQAD